MCAQKHHTSGNPQRTTYCSWGTISEHSDTGVIGVIGVMQARGKEFGLSREGWAESASPGGRSEREFAEPLLFKPRPAFCLLDNGSLLCWLWALQFSSISCLLLMTVWFLFSWVSSSGRKLRSTDEKPPDVSLTSSRCELNTASGLDELDM